MPFWAMRVENLLVIGTYMFLQFGETRRHDHTVTVSTRRLQGGRYHYLVHVLHVDQI